MSNKTANLYHKELFEHFGFNFGFVADLMDKYFVDPNSVSDYWRNYFSEITGEEPASKPKVKSKVKKVSYTGFDISPEDEANLITGVGARIIENMETSLTIPTATSLRSISVKLLEENRRIINQHRQRISKSRLSYTQIVAFAIVKSLKNFPSINNSFALIDNEPHLIKKAYINLGLAVDIEKRDGSRSLIVPNIKKADKMNFSEFIKAYDELILRTKTGKIEPSDFQNSTITLTNPGGLGTISSTPRLMAGQGCIIAIGSIDFPPEFKALQQSTLAEFGFGKVMNITSTYDHRIIQGAESGAFLKRLDNLLLGEDNFYAELFEDIEIPQRPVGWGVDTTRRSYGNFQDQGEIEKQAKILQLINIYRVRGHLISNLNPLSQDTAYHEELDPALYGYTIWDYDRYFLTANLQGSERATLREILEILHKTYCQKIGVEYMHIQNPTEKAWLQSKMEPFKNLPRFTREERIRILEKLIVAESFEHFLHTKFIGHKRFSLEGSETVIPVLDYLLDLAKEDQVDEIVLGMAHRGRLNVLSNIVGKSYRKIFSEFDENFNPDSTQGSGDVKYHLGATGVYKTLHNKEINVAISPNPSHLEFVNPVVEGIVRAKQLRSDDKEKKAIIPLLIHGDAAFAGQGIVAETLNLSQLDGYSTGGTIHIIINNQIGFTTSPQDARSSSYATDVAKMVQSPIFHVNGDDPEASLWVTKIAFEYRQKFKKDVVIDLFGYRRHGHNEGDDPAYTQPLMYKKIKAHPSVRSIYSDLLLSEGIVTADEIKALDDEAVNNLERALKLSKKRVAVFTPDRPLAVSYEELENIPDKKDTKVPFANLSEVVKRITLLPDNFTLNPKLKKHLDKRKELLTGNARIDWAFAEALAFGTLLIEGTSVRLSGQDSARGTFSQRHLILTDMHTGEEFIPHNFISETQAILEPLDSLLSEAAVLGFEFGYSVTDPLTLVIWEAQFGDFANGAQVIIDNFIVSSETKWELPNNLVLLLPHGQEGQGPEHSSARVERFLTLCANNNMYVCYPSTPSQYFHLLRRQVLNKIEMPAIIFTPKSLLRLPAARSIIKEFTEGRFFEILDDNLDDKKNEITKLILTSGKIFYELDKHRQINEISDTAIIRIEQYYPLDIIELEAILKSYSSVKSVRWVQEEPQNMGAWNFLAPRLEKLLSKGQTLSYVGRKESSSPSSGSSKIHHEIQNEIINNAFG